MNPEFSKQDFVARFGGVYEHSPWVAESAAEQLEGDGDVVGTAVAGCCVLGGGAAGRIDD